MTILFGQPVADKILQQVQVSVSKCAQPPCLAVILVGNNPASEVYVNMKIRRAQELGMLSKAFRLPSDATQSRIIELIQTLNHDPSVHGILLQLPLPKHLDSASILPMISPDKDVDGLHPLNMGKLLAGFSDGFVPCTPAGVMKMIEYYQIPVEGKHIVIAGRSNIVGKPLASLLMQKHPHANATVTIVHSYSENIESLLKSADVIIAAMGSPTFIKANMVAPHTFIIDVGTTRIDAPHTEKGYSIVGDVDFNNVIPVCAGVSPVPGGVGPLTVAMLMYNTWVAYTNSI